VIYEWSLRGKVDEKCTSAKAAKIRSSWPHFQQIGLHQGIGMHKFSVVLHFHVPPQPSSPTALAEGGGGGDYFFSLFGAEVWDSFLFNRVTK